MPADIDTLLSLAREVGGMVTEWDESSDGHFIEFTSERELAAYTERIRQDERERIFAALKDWDCVIADEASAQSFIREFMLRSSGTSQSNPLRGGGNG